MAGIFEWSDTAAANASADSEINWVENQPANTINNSARAMMRRIRQFLDDQFGALTTGGTGNAYTVTTKTRITTLRDGWGCVVRANRTNTGACTFNPDGDLPGRSALPWRDEKGNEFQSGDIVLDGYYQIYYQASTNTYRTRLQASRSNPHGGAVLEFTNTSTVTLKPRQDGFLRVGGAAKSIPSSGITGTAAGKQTPLASTNSIANGATATVTLGATHSFVTGQKVLVAGSTNTARDDALLGLKTLVGVTGTAISFPAAVSLASVADATMTVIGVWYVYAYDNNADGVIDTLEFSPTGHTTDAFGVEVKSGDTSRVFVGMVAINSSGGTPVFANDATRHWVRSYYNRAKGAVKGKATAQITSGSTTTVEANAIGLRTYFLCFADDFVAFDQVGDAQMVSSTGAATIGFLLDGVPETDSSTRVQSTNIQPATAAYRGQLAEGLHSMGVGLNVSASSVAVGPAAETPALMRHFHSIYGAIL